MLEDDRREDAGGCWERPINQKRYKEEGVFRRGKDREDEV